MTIPQTDETTPRKPLRLRPGVVLVALQWLIWLALPLVVPDGAMIGLLAAVALGAAVLVWWLFFSRAPWSERVGVLALMVVAMLVTKRIVDPSVATAGQGRLIFVYSIPVFSLALVAGAAAGRRLAAGPRRAAMAAAILLACGAFTLVRTAGVSGKSTADLHWRWTPTPEERLLAEARDEKVAPPAPAAPPVEAPAPAVAASSTPPASASPVVNAPATPDAAAGKTDATPPAVSTGAARRAEWPGFRGPNRDGVIPGVRIATDWAKSPPVELWRQPIGPGWSSFAVSGGLIFTQEQRGEEELVSCHNLTTGQLVWRHRDTARFWESNGGAGPRATPTLSNGRVYTLGATGILNALDAGSGAVVWTRNAASDTGAPNPGWGFAGSPLVVGDVVIVAASGRLAAYDVATGEKRWLGPANGAGYSSPHLMTIDGVPQVLLLRGSRSTSFAPADGTQLWEHVGEPGVSIVQPALAADGDVLIAAGDSMGGQGIRRIAVARGPAGWTASERWMSRGLKPYYNDFVVHEGHAFGFDGTILASIDLADGQRKWKGGRYGAGQMILLPDQDLLLVLSEEGELALVGAAPDKHTELARFKAIEGKTWNHPVLAGDVLLVRNGEEMAAFRMPVASR
jgi:outer membrane protein assembly factor BamB